jgi:hypothetical protein
MNWRAMRIPVSSCAAWAPHWRKVSLPCAFWGIRLARSGIRKGEAILTIPPPEKYALSVTLEGDPNTYYVNAAGQVVWFNEMALPIVLGTYEALEGRGYRQRIQWNDETLFVDGGGVIWSVSNHGTQTPIGRVTELK